MIFSDSPAVSISIFDMPAGLSNNSEITSCINLSSAVLAARLFICACCEPRACLTTTAMAARFSVLN